MALGLVSEMVRAVGEKIDVAKKQLHMAVRTYDTMGKASFNICC